MILKLLINLKNKEVKEYINTKKILIGLWLNLSKKRKYQLSFVFITMILSAFAESISLASVIPFLTLVSEPEMLTNMPFIKNIYLFFNIQEVSQLKLFIFIIFITTVFLSGLIRLFNLWISSMVSAAIGSDLSCKVYKRNLYQPYIVQVRANSSKVISASTQELRFVVQAINLTLVGLTNLFIAISIVATLFILDKNVATIAFITFISFYLSFAFTIRKKLYFNSKKTTEAYQSQVKIIQEGLGGIRDLILSGSQSLYTEMYSKIDRPMRYYQQQANFFSAFPRYALETVGLIMISIFAFSLSSNKTYESNYIPSIGALALGAQRLLPAIQMVYANWANVRANIFNLENVFRQINQEIQPDYIIKSEKLNFKESIKIKNVSFKYGEKYILNNINLTIKKGDTLGITGQTGNGKSTLADIIMGLLVPNSGEILVDNKSLYEGNEYEFISSWRKTIAHVPQNIFIADKSFIENISFGIPYDKIDFKRIKKVAKLSHIHEFIKSTELGYNTEVGERGIRLSGGQRQRIGIARALYRMPDVLVLDEATSSLDTVTEKKVIESIEKFGENITIIMIAHRLSTLKNCNQNIVISNGSIENNFKLEN